VHKGFAKRPLLRRIVALAAAYAITLSSLIGSFGAARAAAAFAAPGIVICHSAIVGQQAPAGDEHSGALCDSSCCIGCLMLVAALPPPPAIAAGVSQSSGRALPFLAVADFSHTPQTRSHQSRAPPIAA
jgi:hypothetical protein